MKYAIILLFFGYALCGQETFLWSQTTFEKSMGNYIDTLGQEKIDTIIEIKINCDNDHRIHFPSGYVYFKNRPESYYKFCGKKFGYKYVSESNCGANWQTIFDFVNDYWKDLKKEKLLPDTTMLPKGKIIYSSPTYYDVVEIIVRFKENTDSLFIRKDYFMPLDNKHYKTNILTKTFLFLNLIECANIKLDTVSPR